jgi:hypothetical protein
MTVLTNIFGLLPVCSTTASALTSQSASPHRCGAAGLADLLTLLVVPAVYVIWRSFELRRLKLSVPTTETMRCTVKPSLRRPDVIDSRYGGIAAPRC